MTGSHDYENEGGLARRMESLQSVGDHVICSQHRTPVLTIRTMGDDIFSHLAVHLTLRGWFSDVNIERQRDGKGYIVHLHSAKPLQEETIEAALASLRCHFCDEVAAAERKRKRDK